MEQHPERIPEPHLVYMLCTTETSETLTSKHYVPRETFVHEIDPFGECVCGPTRVDAVYVMFKHYPLDVRFYEEDAL